MPIYLGFDTSNYTTSAALYDSDSNSCFQSKLLLPVKEGQLGLRQSDAVFHHTKQLPVVVNKLLDDKFTSLNGIGVSVRPRCLEGSYMPCFLCGEGLADCIGAINNLAVYKTSHQIGHILAALYSADKLLLIHEKFIVFHVSGGTTDCLLSVPDDEDILKITEIGTSLDLKAGQAVDRIGIMLGLKFPCGKELEKLAAQSDRKYNIKPVLKEMNCCLSGIENICKKMYDNNESYSDIAKFCLTYIYASIRGMTLLALEKYGKELPVVFAGGVMSNKYIRSCIENEFNAFFAEPEFSCDNAVGTALFAALKTKK